MVFQFATKYLTLKILTLSLDSRPRRSKRTRRKTTTRSINGSIAITLWRKRRSMSLSPGWSRQARRKKQNISSARNNESNDTTQPVNPLIIKQDQISLFCHFQICCSCCPSWPWSLLYTTPLFFEFLLLPLEKSFCWHLLYKNLFWYVSAFTPQLFI